MDSSTIIPSKKCKQFVMANSPQSIALTSCSEGFLVVFSNMVDTRFLDLRTYMLGTLSMVMRKDVILSLIAVLLPPSYFPPQIIGFEQGIIVNNFVM